MNGRVGLAIKSIVVLACLVGLWSRGGLTACRSISFRGRWWSGRGARSHPSLFNSLWITAEEAAGGLLASIVAGVAVAMMFAQWRWLRQLVYPYTILLQTVPIVAIAPLIILWIGPGFPR